MDRCSPNAEPDGNRGQAVRSLVRVPQEPPRCAAEFGPYTDIGNPAVVASVAGRAQPYTPEPLMTLHGTRAKPVWPERSAATGGHRLASAVPPANTPDRKLEKELEIALEIVL